MKTDSFPLRHISIRVPWHDKAWNGSVCANPARNTSCLKLRNIFDNKDETTETAIAGKFLSDVEPGKFPPCVKERATFMANFAFSRQHEHPYVKHNSETHAHFKPTSLHYPAFGAAALPFRWMNRKFALGDSENNVRGLIQQFPLTEVREEYEPTKEVLGFETNWLQDHRNHRALLDCFWGHVCPEDSLVFFYAKQVPLVEDAGRRVIVGVGRVKSIGPLTEYEYDGAPGDKMRSLLWERMVVHSIRPDFKDGFLLPYHEALEKCDDGRAFDPADVVAFAPEDRFEEFSYATEHVGHDAAISALLSCRAALLRAEKLFSVSIKKQEQWIDQELGRLWKKRGPFPGLGSVLSAMGVQLGNFVAQALTKKVGENGNPWSAWDAVLKNPALLPKELSRNIDPIFSKAWLRMVPERRAFLELLSRIDLTLDQARILAVLEDRTKNGIPLSDSDILANPYLIYEATRLTDVPVGIGTVDRGIFPPAFLREKFPLAPPAQVATALDVRRLRALVIRELEESAAKGDTLRAREDIISRLRESERVSDQPTEITGDLLAVAEEEQFQGEIRLLQLADKRPAYQLERLAKVGEVIRSTIKKRIQGARHQLAIDWNNELDKYLGPLPQNPEEREIEKSAREEKAAALAEIAASRFSVLIGPAGTGKTTLLSVLCQHSSIQNGGILLLAPTGKARVRMEAIARKAGVSGFKACTLAQFLSPYDGTKRYDSSTTRYFLADKPGEKEGKTIIVDECSMLTEEMMGAMIEALSGMDRLIFVGDFRQLPPIGAGRPFVDIISHLTPSDIETKFPRVASGYAELTVPRRQGAGERDDLQLAAWFGGSATPPGEDQVFEILAGKQTSEHIKFIRWETPEELEKLLPQVIAETLNFSKEKEEWQSFSESLGGQLDAKGSAWFNVEYGTRPSSGKEAEAWQILSPVRERPWGVDPLNRMIHVRYLGQTLEDARNPGKYRNIPVPMGEAQIVYGDKVINNRNLSIWQGRIYPKPEMRGYLANGEIGMVVGHRRTKAKNWFPDYLEVEFATQTGKVFKFFKSDFDEEGDTSLELAYALTIHKAQGSEFDVVFVVLPQSSPMITRELLYTALTRQKKRIVVLHQGSASDLQKLSSEKHSATASRLTNLFSPPKPVKIGDVFLEERLIHITSRGDPVRSKSEVIIADQLHANRVNYRYELALEIDGITKYPDFTIEDDDSGITYYWEHCGMMSDPAYRKRWKKKLEWYRVHDILPYQDGGGKKGTLIVTEDSPKGGISSQEIVRVIQTVILSQN